MASSQKREFIAISQIKAILFDVDGTLVDTGKAHIHSIRGAFSELGIAKKLTDKEILDVIGSPIEEIFNKLVGIEEFKQNFVQTFRKKMYEEGGIDYLEQYPMLRKTLIKLKEQGFELAIVTNKRRHTTELFLEKAGIEKSIFKFLVTGENAQNYKPAPDLILKAVEKLCLLPCEVALVGDTDLDMNAGRSAEVVTIGAKYGFGEEWEEADYLIESSEDLLILFGILPN